jgi:hypothetical protein
MKAHKSLPRKRERRKPLPARFDEQGQENLPIWKNCINSLGEARLKTEPIEATAHIDAINWLHHRAAALCDIVAEAAYSDSGSKIPEESLAVVMGIIKEDIQVAGWIARKMYGLVRDRRDFPTGGAA